MPYKDKEKQKEAQHKSYLKNRDNVEQRRKNRREENKKFLYEYKIDKYCEICGEKNPATLSFHHIADNKKEDVSTLISSGTIKSIKEEIDKCIIVCENCHRVIHHEFDAEKRWSEINSIEDPRLKKIEEVRRKVYEYKLNHPCIECGEVHPLKLDFHHRNSSEKKLLSLS